MAKLVNIKDITNLRKSVFNGEDVLMYEESKGGITVVVHDKIKIYDDGNLMYFTPKNFDKKFDELQLPSMDHIEI